MTLKELKYRVDWAMEQEQNHNIEVCIPNNKGGVGGTSVTGVINTYVGIDWDSKKFIIFPKKEMIEK